MNKTFKTATIFAASALAITGSFSFASSASAATPVELVNSPTVGIALDGSFVVNPGQWSGDVTTLETAWYVCPTAQLGSIGDPATLVTELTDAGCSFLSADKSVAADSFDNITTFPVVMETVNGTDAAYMGNSIIMYTRGVPTLYGVGASPSKAKAVLYFSGNSATLTKQSRGSLAALVAKSKGASKVVIDVYGFAAKGGNTAKNLKIAMGRARQVQFYFKHVFKNAQFNLHAKEVALSGFKARKAVVKLSFSKSGLIR